MPGIFFKFSSSFWNRGETHPSWLPAVVLNVPGQGRAGSSRIEAAALAGLTPHTYAHPELAMLTVFFFSAWKMYRLNGQDKRTGRRYSGGGLCRSCSEKTMVTFHPPALVLSCYHTMLLLNRLQGSLTPPCHPFDTFLTSFHCPYIFARNSCWFHGCSRSLCHG